MAEYQKRKLEEVADDHEEPCPKSIDDSDYLERLKSEHLGGSLLCAYQVGEAAELGRFKCLEYLFINSCPWDHCVWQSAAAGGHLECLKYIVRQIPQCYTFRWNNTSDINDTNIDCFLYAVQHMNAANEYDPCWRKALLYSGARSLRYAHSKGLPLNSHLYYAAAAENDFEAFQCLYELECPWDEDLCEELIRHRSLEFVKFAHQNKCPWRADACTLAAECGEVDTLKYLHESGCGWDENTFKKAKQSGYEECMEYLREQGCPTGETAPPLRIKEYAEEQKKP